MSCIRAAHLKHAVLLVDHPGVLDEALDEEESDDREHRYPNHCHRDDACDGKARDWARNDHAAQRGAEDEEAQWDGRGPDEIGLQWVRSVSASSASRLWS